ncbi:MAG: hypothetical protein JO066_14870 [Verrucomicrobia bacterium]|nr:hypothetical protein [Verrucomicrobiota bacterium]
MNRYWVLFLIVLLHTTFCPWSCYSQESDIIKKEVDLSRKVVHKVLSQSGPADVKVGLQGITTLEFPTKIEAINGYGFAMQPNLETDEFQLLYDKGTNFLSLKALRRGASANLTVVINEKVYCLYCQEDSDPSFAVIFGAPGENGVRVMGEPQFTGLEKKVVSREQLLGFLDKVKRYSALKTAKPDSVAFLSVAEPNKTTEVGEIRTVIRRVVRDDSLDSVGFEVQLDNRSQSDFYFDPQGFAVRVGDQKYDQSISDAGGIVPAGTSVSAFFAITGTTNGGGKGPAVDQKFDLQIRAAEAATNPNVAPNFTEPPVEHMPRAAIGGSKAANSEKGNVSGAGGKETKKKSRQEAAQANANDHGKKTPNPAPKKHWFGIFKRDSGTVER